MFKNLAIWLVIGLVLMTVFNTFNNRQVATGAIEYSQFMDSVKQGQIAKVVIEGRTLKATTTEGKRLVSYSPGDIWLVSDLLKYGVKIEAKPEEEPSMLMNILVSWFPMLLLIGVWIFFMRQMQGGGKGGAFSFGKSKARMMDEAQNTITFVDVAGCDEAKEEVQEIVDFLRDPSKFQKLGGRIPKGVLMVGNPGTGKTLMAKAVAGEAGVNFFHMSGSDFVEMFVGVGASRVRDLFEQGRQNAPCILFIDEIDAVGRTRGAGYGGGHDEREQTLNQLLVEMDGFDTKDAVIVIAATNRADVLDPALLRPGRFDRQVVVDMPDVKEREAILKIHAQRTKLDATVDLHRVAQATPGMSGADLANMVNEAALFAARRGKNEVGMQDFEEARDKILMGIARRSKVIQPKEKLATAYHEAGHALLHYHLKNSDPLHKVTVVPRGRALGVAFSLPDEDKYSRGKNWLLDRIKICYGGYAAEELVFGETTTGVQNDLEQATTLARRMVTEWGMSDKVGPMALGSEGEPIFLGKEIATHKDYSEETARTIDAEIRRILSEGLDAVRKILKTHRDQLDKLANELVAKETLDDSEVRALLGFPPRTAAAVD